MHHSGLALLSFYLHIFSYTFDLLLSDPLGIDVVNSDGAGAATYVCTSRLCHR